MFFGRDTFFWFRLLGLVAGLLLVITAFGFSAWLIQMGQTSWGVALLVASVAGLIGTAVYGQKARSTPIQGPVEAPQTTTAPQLAQKP